jgi:hypothetical protein
MFHREATLAAQAGGQKDLPFRPDLARQIREKMLSSRFCSASDRSSQSAHSLV